jgi:Uma2 family endonuclease
METATLTPGKKARWTDAEIIRWPKDGFKRELIEGDIYISPVGYTHANVCINLSTILNVHVRKRDLGRVFDSSMGFRLSAQTLLSPDDVVPGFRCKMADVFAS